MKFPDYDRSTLSVTASLMKHYGVSPFYPTLKEIDDALSNEKTRNVVLILLDGMGENLIRRKLPEDSFFLKHDVCGISSVFPSTTTAATTSLWTGLSPLEHGWLGWSLYFKEAGRVIDTFLNKDSFTGEMYSATRLAEQLMPLKGVYSYLKGRVETHAIDPFPSYAQKEADFHHIAPAFADAARIASALTKEPGEKLITIYHNEPDHTMHGKGVSCSETQERFETLDRQMRTFCEGLTADTLVIVTADHGLLDCTEAVEIADIPQIHTCLIMPTSIEMRAAAFFVKPHMRRQFEKEFNAVCGEDFLLIPREEVYASHLLGRGTPHEKTDDFMGDYIACATGKRYLHYRTPASKPCTLIGQHAGLTEDEMTVPVILYRAKEKTEG